MKPIDVLLLSRTDVLALGLTPRDVVDVVTRALHEHAAGTYEMHPKIGVHPTGTDPANFIHAMPAYLKRLGACGLKWVGGFARNRERDLPNVTGIQVYNDTDTGIPLAIMECGYLTGLRTAAVSAIAARLLAVPGARTLALAGCGFEGTKHLRFIAQEIPTIREVRLRDVVPAAMERLAAEALHSADVFVVDDVALAEYFDRIGRDRVTADGRPDPEFPGGMPTIDATIGQLASGARPGRTSPEQRAIAIPIGMAICDVALAHLAYGRARDRGIGSTFRLA